MELFSRRRWNTGSAQQSNIYGVMVMVRNLWLKATKHRHTGNNARCKIGLLTFFNCEWEQSIRGKTYQMGRNLDLQSVSLGPIQPSSPSTKELHGSSGLSRSAAKTQWGSGLHWEEFQSFPIFLQQSITLIEALPKRHFLVSVTIEVHTKALKLRPLSHNIGKHFSNQYNSRVVIYKRKALKRLCDRWISTKWIWSIGDTSIYLFLPTLASIQKEPLIMCRQFVFITWVAFKWNSFHMRRYSGRT